VWLLLFAKYVCDKPPNVTPNLNKIKRQEKKGDSYQSQ